MSLHAVLAGLVIVLEVLTGRFVSQATFTSLAFQLPEIGLLTLAMLVPLISGGLNLAITFSANIAALVLAWVLQAGGGTGKSSPSASCWRSPPARSSAR